VKPLNGAIAGLFFLTTCSRDLHRDPTKVETTPRALGSVPTTEVAVWQRVAWTNLPDRRYLQAVAFDQARRVFVLFGGVATNDDTGKTACNGETWEWSPASGRWTDRTGTGPVVDAGSAAAPDARSGASLVFDSARGKFVLFGGRAGSGYDFQDTWEWDPATGAWTNVTAAGIRPSARCQHGMVYQEATGTILLFGGGRSDPSTSDATVITESLGDTWEFDPVAYAWKPMPVTAGPAARHAFGMVWDSVRSQAVLFGGLQTDAASGTGTPKQDTWEWDVTASAWIERTAAGTKPSPRYGQAMAFDGNRGKVVLFGGLDVRTGAGLTDLWDLDPATFTWTERSTGNESVSSAGVMYASLVADDAGGRLELVAGADVRAPSHTAGTSGSIGFDEHAYGQRSIWELDPKTPLFTDRSPGSEIPDHISHPAFAYNPATGKTYLFAGNSGASAAQLCDWDGKVWSCSYREPSVGPGDWGPTETAMAYDPARSSLILFGGYESYYNAAYGIRSGKTWELHTDGKGTELSPASSPPARVRHRMVTDLTRKKILLFGGDGYNDVWEWDGAAVSWTNRTPSVSTNAPTGREFPLLTYDEGRRKMFLFDGGQRYTSSPTAYWEWDSITAGWAQYDTGDSVDDIGDCATVAYDPIRRRQVIVGNCWPSGFDHAQTWEIDTKTRTLYIRPPATTPDSGRAANMIFDSARGVMVLYAGDGEGDSRPTINETWEYKVTNLGNGEGCTTTSASSCASGFCVEGVCCNVAACAGACTSCNVAGSEGTCAPAAPGSDVSGACGAGLACDGSGACKGKNGQACTAAAECASGFCTDGVCCDSACAGICASCNQTGLAGRCTPYPAGSDPQNECAQGSGACKSACDGVSACAFPGGSVTCGNCHVCDGAGACSIYDDQSCGTGGSGGNAGGSGGSTYHAGGSGGHAAGAGGGGGSQGDAAGDAGNASPHKSGCACALGGRAHPGLGSTAVLLLVAAGAPFLRGRKRGRP
jgi:hypothetical protein